MRAKTGFLKVVPLAIIHATDSIWSTQSVKKMQEGTKKTYRNFRTVKRANFGYSRNHRTNDLEIVSKDKTKQNVKTEKSPNLEKATDSLT